MKVSLSFEEMWYLLESCLRGSHLRTSTIERFVNNFYHGFVDEEKVTLRNLVLDKLYDGEFVPRSECCGKDIWFMERYDMNNRYMVTIEYDGKVETFDTFKHAGSDRYYTGINESLNHMYITKIEKYKYVEQV